MDFDKARQSMVGTQIIARGISDPRVIKAMREVPRQEFVPPELKEISYSDCPLPIGEDQTISQPYIVALMTQELELSGQETVLEIGAGSGYQAAVLSRITKQVYSLERIADLAKRAESVLRKLSYLNVHVLVGDGTLGLSKKAPFDAILVSAACYKIPQALKAQLKDGGRLVIPVGDRISQALVKLTRNGKDYIERKICDCAFVPLVGEDGWEEQ
jgi:protein-L-isoaspartate(D-aspartate) O-methyltransferase